MGPASTSVILLFEVGKAKLLFPGDAQIENWSYAFSERGVLDALAAVNVYKVGSLAQQPETARG